EAGVTNSEELFPTAAGTPQGGMISAFLVNIAPHEMETVISEIHDLRLLYRHRHDIKTAREINGGQDVSRSALWRANAAQEQNVHPGRRALARAGHRSQYSHLQPARRRAAQIAPCAGAGKISLLRQWRNWNRDQGVPEQELG